MDFDLSAIDAIIEIPKGSDKKYELERGVFRLDRILKLPFPQNYGSFPRTLGADGDPLDVVVVAPYPISPNTHVCVRVIGMMEMVDGGENDDKIIAVPAPSVDSSMDNIRRLGDLDHHVLPGLKVFFLTYKPPHKTVEIGDFVELESAHKVVLESVERFKNTLETTE